MVKMKKIGLFGSCQIALTSNFFLNLEVTTKNSYKIMFSLPFYEFDTNYPDYNGRILNYKIFNEIDILIIENNNLTNQASSSKIIEYCNERKIQVIKTFLIYFPIYPINWSGYGENVSDYMNWNADLNSIDYSIKFKNLIKKCRKYNELSDLSTELTDFIEENFNKQLLFDHCLHPTNILLYEVWRYIFKNLCINIHDYQFDFDLNGKNIVESYQFNPFTQKMIDDLDIKFTNICIDDNFYINRHKVKMKEKNMFTIKNCYIFLCIGIMLFILKIICTTINTNKREENLEYKKLLHFAISRYKI
jgi:hypothetical protein